MKFFLFFFVGFFVGCASSSGPVQKETPLTIQPTVASPTREITSYPDIRVLGKQLKELRFDLPITINPRVEYWVDYFCGRGRIYFEKYLLRSEYYAPYIQALLKQNGMPGDLVYLAMIESGFNNLARSHAKAVGPWQFISATGKRYGLKVNWWIDERRDIRKSTLAASAYLKDLYNMFQSWELAAAAYNAGESKILRGLRETRTKDFWSLAKHRFLKQETRDYVPKMIAAALISKNREVFGFPSVSVRSENLLELPAIPASQIEPKEEVSLRALGEPSSEDLTEEDQDEVEETDRSEVASELLSDPIIELTADQKEVQKEIAKSLVKALNTQAVVIPHLLKTGQVGEQHLVEIEFSGPIDLLRVAELAQVSYEELKSFNPEVLRWCTPPQLSLFRLKVPLNSQSILSQTLNVAPGAHKAQFMLFPVRKGDTISKIARFFGIKIDPIVDLNRISAHAPLPKGVKILLPVPLKGNYSFAQLEIKDPPEKRRRRRKVKRRHRSVVSRKFSS